MISECFVAGRPRGKGRPRFRRGGKAYTDAATRAYEKLIVNQYRKEIGKKFIGPIRVNILATFEVPKSWTKRKKSDAYLGLVYPGKPDADNIAKVVLDALNGVAYKDDACIFELVVGKEYVNEARPEEGLHIMIVGEVEG